MAKAIIEKKYVEGRKYFSAERKQTKENGEVRTVYIPQEWDLTVDDVLAVSDKGAELVFVTADGQKHTVTK